MYKRRYVQPTKVIMRHDQNTDKFFNVKKLPALEKYHGAFAIIDHSYYHKYEPEKIFRTG